MKTNLTRTFLVLVIALILQSCGGSQGGSSSLRVGTETNPSQDAYTSEEIELGNKIAGCLNSYQSNFEEIRNQVIDYPELVAIGMTGHECLQIKDPKKLNHILMVYKIYADGLGRDWNLIARENLTKKSR